MKLGDIAEALEKAADLIEIRGHYRGDFESPSGSLCLWGAINTIVTGEADHMTSTDDIRAFERALGFDELEDLDVWNDECWRTADEVIERLRHSAKDLRNTHPAI